MLEKKHLSRPYKHMKDFTAKRLPYSTKGPLFKGKRVLINLSD